VKKLQVGLRLLFNWRSVAKAINKKLVTEKNEFAQIILTTKKATSRK